MLFTSGFTTLLVNRHKHWSIHALMYMYLVVLLGRLMELVNSNAKTTILDEGRRRPFGDLDDLDLWSRGDISLYYLICKLK